MRRRRPAFISGWAGSFSMKFLPVLKQPQGILSLLLGSCSQQAAEQHPAAYQAVSPPKTVPTASAVKPTPTYTSGDRVTNGPNDTLPMGSTVLRLVPGSKSDFAAVPRRQPLYAEARTIRQHGNGRVKRVGYTLIVRPFNGVALRFSDDTHQMRKDDNEETDTHCQFSGSLSGRPYWLIDSLQGESYQPFLVNKYSGRATLLSWNPELSPDRRHLFVATPGLAIESTLNGLPLWAISDQEVKLIWTRTLRNWQPHQVRWLNKHTLAVEQLRFEPTQKTSYARLLLP
jgi:hypothetical protein